MQRPEGRKSAKNSRRTEGALHEVGNMLANAMNQRTLVFQSSLAMQNLPVLSNEEMANLPEELQGLIKERYAHARFVPFLLFFVPIFSNPQTQRGLETPEGVT